MQKNVHSILPILTVNELFVEDLLAAEPPCFGLSYVEEAERVSGFIAMRPNEPIPSHSTNQGFCFGHSVLGLDNSPVMQFAFDFYDHKIYHGLANPGSPNVQAVLKAMVETQDYYFFAINPDQSVTTFRSRLETADLVGLRTNLQHFQQVTCLPSQYDKTVSAFKRNPSPPGEVMEWVCRDNEEYLDLIHHRLDLKPSP